MIFHKETKKSKFGIDKLVYFTYRGRDYTMYIHYQKKTDRTSVSFFKTSVNYRDLEMPKSTFMYHTKCLNVQQHINNFIIELKEKGL